MICFSRIEPPRYTEFVRKKAGVYLASLAVTMALGFASDGSQPSAERLRQALRTLARAAPNVHWDGKSMVAGDIACDGRLDPVYLGHSNGRIYVGFVRSANRKPEVLEFGVGPGHQAAICQEPAKLAVERLDYNLDGAEGFRQSRICKGLVLDDDTCDSIHFFWNHATQHLNWWRN